MRLVILVAALVAGAAPLAAQRSAGGGVPARPAMERLANAVARRLNLDADQAQRLQTTTRRFATDREQLMRQERQARQALRAQLAAGQAADQQAVGRQLDDLLRLQQRRVQLLSDEQRELAGFLSPVQRAEFLGMQERAFRAAQQIRQQRANAGGRGRAGAGQPRP